MSDMPKVTVFTSEIDDPRVFIGETELNVPEIWSVKAESGWGKDAKVIVEFPASVVEFKSVDD